MASPRLIALGCAFAFWLLLGGCARTALDAPCPQGMTADGESCVCVTDQGCPLGFGCEDALRRIERHFRRSGREARSSPGLEPRLNPA